MSDRDAELERFCARAYPRLVAALTHHCGDVYLAEELAQEALVRACRRWQRVGKLESPIGWTYRVGANLGNSWLRRRGAEQRARRRAFDGHLGVHRDPDTADHVAVREALDDLTDKQRTAVVLRYFLDLSAEEAAQVMGSTPGAFRALVHRAVLALRDVLDVRLADHPEEVHDAQ